MAWTDAGIPGKAGIERCRRAIIRIFPAWSGSMGGLCASRGGKKGQWGSNSGDCRKSRVIPGVNRVIAIAVAMKRFHLHLVSDATGETINSVARAAIAQFEGIEVVEHFWSLIRGRRQIEPVGQLREGLALSVMINVAQSFRDNALQWSINELASRLGVPATALSPVVDRLLSSGMLAITEHEKLLPGREISRIRIGDILSTIRENRDIPKLEWEPKVGALTTRVNDAIAGATGDTTLADMLD